MATKKQRRLIGILVFFAALIGAALGYRTWKSPEDTELDEAVRAVAPGDFVQLSDGVTHYDLTGPDAGRLVVLVHGFSVPYYIWDSTVVALTDLGYRVLRYDLFGRGFSDRPNAAYDGAFYDDQLSGLLDALRITDPVDLVGLSFGGFVAAHFVGSHPDRVRTVTFVDPMSEQPEVQGFLGLPVIGSWFWHVSVVPGLAEGQMTDFLHPENYPTWVDQYRPQMRYRGFGRALLSTVLMSSRVDFEALYGKVAETGIPALLIWGKQDHTVAFTLSEVVRRNIPSVEFAPVDSAGHLPHIEQSGLVHARLHAFLETHSPSAQVSER